MFAKQCKFVCWLFRTAYKPPRRAARGAERDKRKIFLIEVSRGYIYHYQGDDMTA